MSRLYKKGEIAAHPCGGWSLPILDPEGIEITTIEYVCSRDVVMRQLGEKPTGKAVETPAVNANEYDLELLKQTEDDFGEIAERWEVDGTWYGQTFKKGRTTFRVAALDENTDGMDWILCVNESKNTVERFTYDELYVLLADDAPF